MNNREYKKRTKEFKPRAKDDYIIRHMVYEDEPGLANRDWHLFGKPILILLAGAILLLSIIGIFPMMKSWLRINPIQNSVENNRQD